MLYAIVLSLALLALPVRAQALDAAQYWPNFGAVRQGYYLSSPEGDFRFALYGEGDSHFALVAGCAQDHYAWLNGLLYYVYSVLDCSLTEVWSVPAAPIAQRDFPGPTRELTTLYLTTQGQLSSNTIKTYIANVSEGVVHFVAEQSSGMREDFWFDPAVPVCDSDWRMPGVRRYRKSFAAHGVVGDVQFCWRR